MGPLGILILALFIIVLAVVALNIKIVPQSKAYVIERLGAYQTTWQTGLHVKIPIFERVSFALSVSNE